MKDVEIHLANYPGTLATMSKALGAAGISIEGGGVWTLDGRAAAHFLFADAAPVAEVLASHGIKVVAENEAVMLRLDQQTPGQLGLLTGLMAKAGVNITVQYSDHDHRLVLVVDDIASARGVADAWMRERQDTQSSFDGTLRSTGRQGSLAGAFPVSGHATRIELAACTMEAPPAGHRCL